MYLHIGGDRVVPLEDLIVIIDARYFEERGEPEFLAQAWSAGELTIDDEGEVHSYVVVRNHIYGTKITAATLRRRVEQFAEGLAELESATHG